MAATGLGTLWVPGPLPGLNELIAAAKSGRGRGNAYSRLKAEWTNVIVIHAKAARVPAFSRRVFVTFEWVEKTRKRDPDNIAAGGRKLVLDALVKAGVLQGDGWKYLATWTDRFVLWHPGLKGPGVGVTIQEETPTVLMDAGVLRSAA